MKNLFSGFLDSSWTLGLVCVAMLCLTTGFVGAPFPRWSLGEVIEINPQQMTLVVQENGSKKSLSLRWNKATRLWVEPNRRKDRGIPFDPKNLTLGAPVQIMFKKYSDHSLVTRVILLASPMNAS